VPQALEHIFTQLLAVGGVGVGECGGSARAMRVVVSAYEVRWRELVAVDALGQLA